MIARFRAGGWEAGWANRATRPELLVVEWAWDAIKPIRTTPPDHVVRLAQRVGARAAALATKLAVPGQALIGGGLLDILAWRGEEICFIECKHQGVTWRDNLQKSQELWIAAAVEEGVDRACLGVFEWRFG